MKNDAYTKTVLTIIAICLVWICVRDVTISRPAQASEPQPVIITGVAKDVETSVIIRGIQLSPYSSDSLPVRTVK
jgi:hypothetical protein